METFATRVIRVDRCGEDILTLRLVRPEGYQFRSGQWFRLFLDTPEGEQARTFSHASTERDDWIELTTRLSASNYKQTLSKMEVGEGLRVSPPGGRLALPSDAERIALLIGGVGITPVRSLLRDAWQSGRAFEQAVVFYGNRDETCEPYLDELLAMSGIGVSVVRVLEHPRADWEGERGFITAEIVRRHVGDREMSAYVIAGPPVMVESMGRVLDDIGIEASRRIVEAFGSLKAVS